MLSGSGLRAFNVQGLGLSRVAPESFQPPLLSAMRIVEATYITWVTMPDETGGTVWHHLYLNTESFEKLSYKGSLPFLYG